MDCTHLLAIFDAPTPEVILGSDILSKTPANVLAHTYCLNEALVKEALAPVKPQTYIGPPADCCKPPQVAGENMKGTKMAPANLAPVMDNANMSPYMHQPAPQAFGYQPMAVHGYYTQPYAQPYAQPYRQQPNVQGYPVFANAVHETGIE
ncbi:hypothetical protein KC345_g11563 [Hortaea werneckii]|nr:hypothetical protein KC345_g11563 [Hortaea werneckii]